VPRVREAVITVPVGGGRGMHSGRRREVDVVNRKLAGPDELGGVPAVLDLPEAARLLGIGRTLAYQLVRDGRWPTPVVRVGRLIKVPTRPLLEFLGADAD
jgi:excisionase family DNA binding protein